MKVELIQIPTEITDYSIRQYLADCSSVVRNKQPKDNDRLFDRLRKESYGDRASRVFEFVPCSIDYLTDPVMPNNNQLFGFYDKKTFLYYTNARELLNSGVSWEDVLARVDFTHYRAVKITAPYFLYGQASTHTQITSVSHSNRYTEAGLGYWMPDEYLAFEQRFNPHVNPEIAQIFWDSKVNYTAPQRIQDFMREELGIKRREVYARGADMLAYRVYTLGGYLNNPNAWLHFINQRLRDPHTQKEMRELAAMIHHCIQEPQ